jgi:hypothetical protein
MGNKTLAVIVFGVGILLMNFYTSFAYLWLVVGLPIPSFTGGAFGAFAPPLGAVLLFVAGLIYARGSKGETA